MAWTTLRFFSSVAQLNSIRILFSVIVNTEWPLFQLDDKNAFLYWDLKEQVYMKQPPWYIAEGRILSVDSGRRSMNSNKVQGYGLRSSTWLYLVLNSLVVIHIIQYLFVELSLAQ